MSWFVLKLQRPSRKELFMIKQTVRLAGIMILVVLASCSPKIEKLEPVILQELTPTTAFVRLPYRLEEVVESVVLSKPKIVYRRGTTQRNGISWVAAKVDNGSPKIEEKTYIHAYDQAGNLLSKTLVPNSKQIIPATPIVYQYGARPTLGAVFYPRRIFRYGADCRGCRPDANGMATTASGIKVSPDVAVQQADGTWKDGILYEGYYVLASDRALPLCTIVEITNHQFSGYGLTPGKPFKAIILDRGVSNDVLDLYVGTEKNINAVRLLKTQFAKVTIIGFGTYTKNALGSRICKVN